MGQIYLLTVPTDHSLTFTIHNSKQGVEEFITSKIYFRPWYLALQVAKEKVKERGVDDKAMKC